jgi:hypothetical protein
VKVFVSLPAVELYEKEIQLIKNLANVTYLIDSYDLDVVDRPHWVKPQSSWYSTNLVQPQTSSGKLLPLGVERRSWAKFGNPKLLRWEPPPLNGSVLVGPFKMTHESRSRLYSFDSTSNIHIYRERVNPKVYSNLCSKFDFILCPSGNGIDTYRFWETLYRGRIPIVTNSNFTDELIRLGVPLLAVESFSELWEWSPKQFETLAKELEFKPEELPYLSPKYWLRMAGINLE